MLISLILLLVCTLLIMYTSVADAYFTRSCQPRQWCLCRVFVTWPLAVITIFLILLVWVVAAALLGTSNVMADFCISPTTNIINVASITDNVTLYYVSLSE